MLFLFSQPVKMTFLVLVLAAAAAALMGEVEGRKVRILEDNGIEYGAISCRAHTASITDFGGVGDGETSNTKAFKAAVERLSQYAGDGGAQLYVPAGRWLTGSFNLTSHFTLFLHQDAVLLASQVEINNLLFSSKFKYFIFFIGVEFKKMKIIIIIIIKN